MKFEISRPASTASAASAATPSDKTTSLPRASVKALPNGRIEVLIDGVKYTGAELIDGKRIQLKKRRQKSHFRARWRTLCADRRFLHHRRRQPGRPRLAVLTG